MQKKNTQFRTKIGKTNLQKQTKNKKKQANTIKQNKTRKKKYMLQQYTTKLNSEKIKKFVRAINDHKVSKKHFNFRLAPADESQQMTGYGYNAVAPLGIQHSQNIPIILSHRLLEFSHFWMGGGEVDVKLAVNTHDFRNHFKPYVANIVYDGYIDPTENLE